MSGTNAKNMTEPETLLESVLEVRRHLAAAAVHSQKAAAVSTCDGEALHRRVLSAKEHADGLVPHLVGVVAKGAAEKATEAVILAARQVTEKREGTGERQVAFERLIAAVDALDAAETAPGWQKPLRGEK